MIMIETNIKKVKRLFTLFCLVCLYLGWARPAYGATGYMVRGVQVEGNVLVDADLLIALSGLQEGTIIEPFSAQIRSAICQIAKHDGIKSVEIYLAQVDQVNHLATLVIQVAEHPQLANLVLEGTTKKEQKALLETLSIDKHVALSPLLLEKTKAKIKKFFLEKGFRDVQLLAELIPDQKMDQKVTLKIKINKGKKSTIHKIIFEGNHHLDANLLIYHMQELKEAPRFTLVQDILKKSITLTPIRKGGILLGCPKTIGEVKRYFAHHVSLFPSVFTEEKYVQAKEKLMLFYQSQGFRDVHIATERLKFLPDGRLNIHLKINEGKQYVVRHIKWIGNYVYSDQRLNKVLSLNQARIYDPNYIRSRLVPGMSEPTIADVYTNNGYLFFRSEVVETGIEDNQVDLEIRIHEGKQATIRQVDIIGNTLTHDYVIRRELLTLPGQTYNSGLVRESLRNLAMLQCFKLEKLTPDLQPNEETGTVDLIYPVEEQPKFDLQLKFKGGQDIMGELELGSNNVCLQNLFKGKAPLGAGQQFHLKAQMNGKDYKNFTFSFQEPWLWLNDKRYICSVNFNSAYHTAFYSEKSPLDDWVSLNIFPIGKQDQKYKIHSIGGRLSLGKKVAKYWELHWGIDYHYHSYRYYTLLQDNIKRSGPLHDFTLDFSWLYHTINHPNYPTSGACWSNCLTLTPPYTLLGMEVAEKNGLPRVKEFGKFVTDGYYYKRLVGNCVLHLRGHAGFLHSLSKRIGAFERFYLGGTSCTPAKLLGSDFISLRCYPDDSLTPEDYTNKVKGGVVFGKVVSELRYAISIQPICFYLLGFLEMGDSWLHYQDINLLNMKKSIGAGMRLTLPIPMIPTLGVDFGYRLDPIKDIRGTRSTFEYNFVFGPTPR